MTMPESGANPVVEENNLADSPPAESNPSSTQPDVNQDGEQNGNNQEEKQGKSEPFQNHPRFKEVISDRDKWKAKAMEYEQALSATQNRSHFDNNRQKQQPAQTPKQEDSATDYAKYFAERQYQFKDPSTYESMQDLYVDIRDNMLSDILTFISARDGEYNQKLEAQREENNKILDEIDAHFDTDKERKEAFYTFAEEEVKNGNTDIRNLLRVFERFNPAKSKAKADDKDKVNAQISKGTNAQRPDVTGQYDPKKYRGMSMTDMTVEMFNLVGNKK